MKEYQKSHAMFPHSYRSFIAYYTPETCHITLDISLIKELVKDLEEPIRSFVCMPFLFHEISHFSKFSGTSGKVPGIILNLVKIRLENIEEITRGASDIVAAKERILEREILWNKLFISSYLLVEAMSILEMEYFYNVFISTGKLANAMWDTFKKPYCQKIFKKFVSLLEPKILPKIGEKKFHEIEENVWKKLCVAYTQRLKESQEKVFKTFMELIARNNKFYEELKWLSSQSSYGFALFIALLSLDIPLCSNPKASHELDLQHDPSKRFELLITKLKELNEKRPLKEMEAKIRYRSLPRAWKGLLQFISQLVELETFDSRKRIMMMKRAPFTHLSVRFPMNEIKDREQILEYMFSLTAKYFRRTKSFSQIINIVINKLVSMPIFLKYDAKERLFLNKEFLDDDEWKSWWCKNVLILDLKYERKIKDPLRTYNLTLKPEKLEEFKRVLEFAKKINRVDIKPTLIKELRKTNREIEKITRESIHTSQP